MLNLVVVWESMPNLWPTISIGVIVFLVLFAMLAEKSTTHSGVIIGVEGNISSGKSTLCSTLQNQVCQSTKQPIRVMFEEISSLLLQLFYSDHKRYALTLQLTTLQRRIDNLVHIKKSVAEQKNIGLLDRSTMVGDLLFLTVGSDAGTGIHFFYFYRETYYSRSSSIWMEHLTITKRLSTSPNFREVFCRARFLLTR